MLPIIKFEWVWLQQNLNWSHNINKIQNEISKSVGAINRWKVIAAKLTQADITR